MTRTTRVERLERMPHPGLDAPTGLRFTTDGAALTYLRFLDDVPLRGVWRHELQTGERRLLIGPGDGTAGATDVEQATHDELMRQRMRDRGEGIPGYERAQGADVVAALVSGRCLVSVDGAGGEPVPGVEGALAAALAPDGERLAWVREGDLFVSPTRGAGAPGPIQLTDDATDGVTNGLPDYIAAEELDRYEGMWWNAAGDAIAVARVDEREIPPVDLTPPGSDRSRREVHRYPFAGGPNARVDLRIAHLGPAPGISGPVDIGVGDGYLARVVPHPGGGWLVAVLPRDQRSLRWSRLLEDGTLRELWVEWSEPWLNLDELTRVLADGRILRATEASGFRHLELREPDGSGPRALTTGPWVVTDVAHVDEARGEVLVIGTADGVLERHLYAVSLDETRPVARPRRFTAEPGWHEVAVSEDGARWADSHSSRQVAPRVVVHARDGRPDLVIHEPTATAGALAIAMPDLLEIAADDGTPLEVAVFRPTDPAGAPPPAILWVYGGPHSQYVQDAWDLTIFPLRQALVAAGFAVVMADNRGTANRGLAFEAPIAGALGGGEIEDQARVVRVLADRGELDATRVGVTGGSYGGYLTIRALQRHPELFRAGVAVAPVVDWDGYDTAYTERYLGTPAANPAAYQEASLLPRAAELPDALLVQHGAIDENVHLRHSQRLAAALEGAGRHLDLLVLPDERHLVRAPATFLARHRRTVAFLCRALGVPLPDDVAQPEPDPG